MLFEHYKQYYKEFRLSGLTHEEALKKVHEEIML